MATTSVEVIIPEKEQESQSLNVLSPTYPNQDEPNVPITAENDPYGPRLDPAFGVGSKEEIDAANASLNNNYGSGTSILNPLPQTEEAPTVISTDSMRDQLAGAEKTLKELQAQIAAGEIVGPDEPKPETTTTTVTPEVDPDQKVIDDYAISSQKLIDQRQKDFDKYLTRSDNLLKSQVRAIKKTFDVRSTQADKVAQNAKAATRILGSRTGRSRYAPEIQAGIITGQENALIETLAQIDALELSAIAAAEEAAYNRDYTTFLDSINNIDTLRKEREKTLGELQDALDAENERMEEEIKNQTNEISVIEQLSLGLTDPVEIFQALGGTVGFDFIKQYTDAVAVGGTELEFIKGDKYQRSGYFNPVTGEFVSLSGYVPEVGEGGGGGTGFLNGYSNFFASGDIDSLPISEAAKSYIRLWQRGEMTTAEIQQAIARQGTSADVRKITNEVMSVISRLQAPKVAVDQDIQEYMRSNAEKALNAIQDVWDRMNVTITEDPETGEKIYESGALLGTEASGLYRTWFKNLPGTDAKAIESALTTVRAVAGFNALQEMRNNSPTGGALGQVTEIELALLQATIASMDQGQDNRQFLQNLKEIEQHFQKIVKENNGQAVGIAPNYSAMSNDALLYGSQATESSDPNGIY